MFSNSANQPNSVNNCCLRERKEGIGKQEEGNYCSLLWKDTFMLFEFYVTYSK